MLSAVVIFVLLFNLTSTSSQEVSKTQKFHDTLQLKSKENPKSNDINTKRSNFSANDVNGKQSSNTFARNSLSIPLENDPFSGKKDQNRDQRQLDANQAQEKLNNGNAHNEVPSKQEEANDPNKNKVIAPNNNNNSPSKQIIKSNVTANEIKSIDGSSTIPIRINAKEDILQSGALLRGFYVFIGFSVLVMLYMFFRSYRLRHGTQPSTTVRKYGITARRSDMEMRPLELEDDDDDTLFEVGNPSVNR